MNEDVKPEGKSGFNLNTYLLLGGFLISFSASIGSYFKALGDIRQEIQMTLYTQAREIRNEVHSEYATKEETRFIQSALNEMKSDLKDIKSVVMKR